MCILYDEEALGPITDRWARHTQPKFFGIDQGVFLGDAPWCSAKWCVDDTVSSCIACKWVRASRVKPTGECFYE